MKKISLIFLAMIIMAGVLAQTRFAKAPIKSIPLKSVKNQDMPSQPVNQSVNSKAVLEDNLGNTYYDMQTNASVDTRITVYPDGTIGAAWIRGTTNSNDRGTGYNYFDGAAWGPAPTARIENDRTGWPSYAPLGPSGEIVIAHLNDGLKVSKRDVKGQGVWNQNVLMGPAGATDISWPRIMTNGPNHNYVHMLTNTYVVYEGLDLAILYYRSLDGGLTWDKNGIVLPQMTSTDYDGFNGDQMAWGTPHGDTIYFVVSGPWIDSFIMKSFDNGNTWTKVPILSNANKKLAAGTTDVPPFTSSDGSCAVEMDNDGVFHVAFGIGGGYMEGGSKYIYVNRNGLVYWNSMMPMLQDSLDLDTLEAHGQLLGAVYNGPNPGDTIIDVPGYRVGLSSMPQISVDDYNNLYFLWSAATPGNPSPDPYNYRHIWGRAKFANQNHMTDQMDLNGGVMYLFTEYVYPAMAKRIKDNNIALMYQSAAEPGSNIVSTTIAQHECNIEYRKVPTSMFIPTGTGNAVTNGSQVGTMYPNPVKDNIRIPVSLVRAADVTVDIATLTGQQVLHVDMGTMTGGANLLKISTGSLSSGFYLVSIKIDNETVTRKMMVE